MKKIQSHTGLDAERSCAKVRFPGGLQKLQSVVKIMTTRLMKCFEIELKLFVSWTEEDAKCPSQWAGSGVYDIEVRGTQSAIAFVFAESKEEAEKKILDFDFISDKNNDYIIEEAEPEIKSIREIDEDLEDYGEDVNVYYREPYSYD